MREYVNLDVLANWVVMLRAEADGAVWLADDDDEARFYQRCAHGKAKIISAPGLAIQLLDFLEARGLQGLVATVCRAETATPARDNVFRPSSGDIASLLLFAKSCDPVITDICGTAWLLASDKQIGPIRSRVVSIARILDEVRRACLREHVPPLDLERIGEFIRWDTLELAWDQVRSVLSARGFTSASMDQIQSTAGSASSDAGEFQCDGMDAIQVLAAATKLFQPRGIKAQRAVSTQDLIGMLRLAFNLGELEGDKIFWQMKQWEWKNQRYPLLSEWRTLDSLGVVLDQRYWEADLDCMLRLLGPDGKLAAFKLDLDNFKALNDALGHTMGDEAIRTYCRIIKALLHRRGEVYRRGGDEVVALAPGLDATAAELLGEEIRRAIEAEFRGWGERHGLAAPPTASIGLVLADGPTTANQVIKLLDAAELQAKRKGKNRVESVICANHSEART